MLEQGFDERGNRGVEVFEKILSRRNIDVLKEMPVLDKSRESPGCTTLWGPRSSTSWNAPST